MKNLPEVGKVMNSHRLTEAYEAAGFSVGHIQWGSGEQILIHCGNGDVWIFRKPHHYYSMPSNKAMCVRVS